MVVADAHIHTHTHKCAQRYEKKKLRKLMKIRKKIKRGKKKKRYGLAQAYAH